MNAKRPTRGKAATTPAEAARLAGELAAAAGRAGAVGARVTDAQRRLRDTAIVASLDAGESVTDTAKRFGITRRQVERIRISFHAAPTALDDTPMQVLEHLLRSYRVLIADFEAMAAYYMDTHPPVALGAKRSAVDVRERMQTLLAVTGKLPDNLEIFASEAEMLRFADLTLAKLRQVEAGDITAEAARHFVQQAILSSGPLPVIDGRESAP